MTTLAEALVIEKLERGSLLIIMDEVIEHFIKTHGSKPEILIFNRSLRAAFIREVVKFTDSRLADAISEPFWYSTRNGMTPVVFTLHPTNEHWLIAQDNSLRKDYRL